MKQEENMSNTQSMDNSKSKLNIRWAFVILLLIGAIVNYLDRANLSVANTTIAREFHLSSTQMGLLLSAFLWPYAIANLPSGWLVDKFGPKKMFFICIRILVYGNYYMFFYKFISTILFNAYDFGSS